MNIGSIKQNDNGIYMGRISTLAVAMTIALRAVNSPNPKAPRFPLIAERYKDGNPASVLIDGTVVRHPGMPEFRLLENETDGLVAYIRRISRKWKPARAP